MVKRDEDTALVSADSNFFHCWYPSLAVPARW